MFYAGAAEETLERRAVVMWGSPRYAHFHTCGDHNPGEVLLSIIDPTIVLDGQTYWRGGRFLFLERDGVRALPEKYPGFEPAFEHRMVVGI